MKKKETATTYQQELSEVEKKRKRDKIRRTIVFGIFGVCACLAAIFLLIGSIVAKFTKIEYPASTLEKEKQPVVETKTYEDLTQVISFGPYYMCIPTEDVVSATEESLMMQDAKHIYSFTKSAANENSTLNSDLPMIINSIGANTYNPCLTDSGYLNTIRIAYVAGSAKSNGSLYFVAYELFSEDEKLEILITARNQGNLNEAKDLLDRMIYTLIEKDANAGAEENLQGATTEEITPPGERAADAPKSLSRDGVRSKYLYDTYYTGLMERTSVSTKGAYDSTEKALFYHVQNATTSLDYDRVYFEVTVSFSMEDAAETYFGTEDAGCYLIDINSYEMKEIAVDRSYSRALTYVFECPNEYLGAVNDYDIVIHDPLKKVEHVYFVVNEPENCKYSPYYVEPENMDGIQKEDSYDEDIEEWTGDLEGAEEEKTLQ